MIRATNHNDPGGMMATKTSRSKSSTSGDDAVAMLKADHKKVKQLFAEFKKMKDGSDEEKSELVARVCNELIVHAVVEEEIFYPAVREAIDDADLMDEALVEHAAAKSLIEQLQGMEPEDDLYDAKVTVLGEQIEHHVEEEEGEMFKQAKRSKVDTVALGEEMLTRKMAMMQELGMDAAEDDDAERAAPKSRSAKSKGKSRR
ncbi:MAG: hypothetical protein NVSMB10_10590 [Steroidobacteraceae bacterium]